MFIDDPAQDHAAKAGAQRSRQAPEPRPYRQICVAAVAAALNAEIALMIARARIAETRAATSRERHNAAAVARQGRAA